MNKDNIIENGGIVDKSLYYLASFGAASLAALIVLFVVALPLWLVGSELSLTSLVWIFLFLFPGMLSLANFFIGHALEREEEFKIIYGVIAGYALYSILSFLATILTAGAASVGWLLSILLFVTIAVFISGWVAEKVGALFNRAGHDDAKKSDSKTRKSAADSAGPVFAINLPGKDSEDVEVNKEGIKTQGTTKTSENKNSSSKSADVIELDSNSSNK